MKNLFTELDALLKNKIVAGAGCIALTFVIFSSHTCRNGEHEAVAPHDKSIQVTGSSEMVITPDDIEFVIGITEESYGLLSTKRQVNRVGDTEKQIKEKLAALGVKAADIKTELTINSYWWWYENRHTNVSKQINFKVSDFATITKFVEELDVKGVQYMHLGELSHKKILDYRKKVKTDALKAAKEKAAYLLESIGKKAGAVITITELQDQGQNNAWNYWSGYNSNTNILSNSVSSSSNSSTSNGNSEIRSIQLRYEVQATFEIAN